MAVDGGAIEGARRRGASRSARRSWALARARSVPRGMWALLAVALVEAVVWCVVLPPLQGPDEISHFSYVQKIAETGSIPWTSSEPSRPTSAYSEEVSVAGLCSGITALEQNPSARAPASSVDEQACYAALNRLPAGAASDGGYTSADKNPPLYYLYETVPYLLFHHSTFFTRSFVMRLANIPFVLALVVFVWLLAGELLLGLPRGPALRAVATAAVVVNPQLTMLSATINPDILLAAEWAAGLWLAVTIVRRGLTPVRAAWLVGVCVLAGFTQGRGLPLVAVAVLALAMVAWRARPRSRRQGAAAAAVVLAAVAAAVYLVLRYALRSDVTVSRTEGFLSYLWQFYLPRLGFMSPPIHPGYGVRQVFIDRFLGTFAQLEVSFSASTLSFLSRAAEVVAAMALVGLVWHRRRLRRAWPVAAVLAVAALGYLALLHAVAFSSLLTNSADPVITGRYLLPLLAFYGVGIALALSWLPRRLCAVLSGATVAGLSVLQLSALAILLERFYG